MRDNVLREVVVNRISISIIVSILFLSGWGLRADAGGSVYQIISEDDTCLAYMFAGRQKGAVNAKKGYALFVEMECDKEQYQQMSIQEYSAALEPECVTLYWQEKVIMTTRGSDREPIKTWVIPLEIDCTKAKATPKDGSFCLASDR